ncbi:MAG: type II toxin-antitoxin system HicA family toxin [Pyrinomonadaceae bacterium]
MAQLLQAESFRLDRVSGSHHIYKKGDIIFVLPVHQ